MRRWSPCEAERSVRFRLDSEPVSRSQWVEIGHYTLASGALFGDATLQSGKVLPQAKQICGGGQAVVFKKAKPDSEVIPLVSQIDQ